MPSQFQLHRRILQLRTCMHVQMYKKKPTETETGKMKKFFQNKNKKKVCVTDRGREKESDCYHGNRLAYGWLKNTKRTYSIDKQTMRLAKATRT